MPSSRKKGMSSYAWCGIRLAAKSFTTDTLAQFTRRFPDVPVLDIGLPVMDGYELGREIRGLPGGERCRLVAMTGYGQLQDRARSAASGFHCHLVKPTPIAHVVECVRSALGLD